MEQMKQHIECSKQFDYLKAFNEIDDWSYGFIDKKNLKSFLRKHGCIASNKDVMSIIRRMDLDGDARLS
jgi:Ca2+-binding EF-hand superfamily protein